MNNTNHRQSDEELGLLCRIINSLEHPTKGDGMISPEEAEKFAKLLKDKDKEYLTYAKQTGYIKGRGNFFVPSDEDILDILNIIGKAVKSAAAGNLDNDERQRMVVADFLKDIRDAYQSGLNANNAAKQGLEKKLSGCASVAEGTQCSQYLR